MKAGVALLLLGVVALLCGLLTRVKYFDNRSSASRHECGIPPTALVCESSVLLSSNLIESTDRKSHFLYLVREDVKRIESEDDAGEIEDEKGAKIAGVFGKDPSEVILKGIRLSGHHHVAASHEETIGSDSSCDFALGAWRFRVVPKLDPEAGQIALNYYVIAHDNNPEGCAGSITIWIGDSVVFQLFEKSEPACLMFLSAGHAP